VLARLAAALRRTFASVNWACWVGQHHWQRWFEMTICLRCQQIGFRRRD
jgi:hypothetical protein